VVKPSPAVFVSIRVFRGPKIRDPCFARLRRAGRVPRSGFRRPFTSPRNPASELFEIEIFAAEAEVLDDVGDQPARHVARMPPQT